MKEIDQPSIHQLFDALGVSSEDTFIKGKNGMYLVQAYGEHGVVEIERDASGRIERIRYSEP